MLAELTARALRAHAHRPLLSDDGGVLTGAGLDAAASAAETGLRPFLPEVAPARVGLQAGNSTAYVVVYLALLRAGCLPFLLDLATAPAEVAGIAETCGLDLLLHEQATAPPHGVHRGRVAGLEVTALTPRPDRPDTHPDTEVCRFTSGSTGSPHCIEFSGRAVHRAAANWALGTGLTGSDTIACFASLSNGLAFNTSLLSAFLVGAHLRLGRGLPTAGRVARLLQATGATRLTGFPALYESLVRRGGAVGAGTLRMAVSSAAPLPAEVKLRFTELTGVPVQNYYGVAEAGPLTFAADPRSDPGLGQPLPGVSLRAGEPGDPGPVRVRSESMGTRYLGSPGLLEGRVDDEGFYRTGDLGHLEGGSLVLAGRADQLINVGGRKVDAAEVARVLRGAEGVRDAVVLEVPDRHGSPALAAVLCGGDPAAARGHAAGLLAAHKVPTLLRVVDEIPRGTTGKPALSALRRLFA
ncbi:MULTISPECIES: class I adenylate-forming enzyme family protein [Actinosynnema]|uniref:MitE n=1 Tax=Actinosynnema pretiosum TaxID=42197 RepID=A0A290Z6J0_9PSEU|nr:class I adenylate-forming enzyme family protein [Actinosynnema pretiosum]ATE54589.1 MitE [Actinosynnema pretiosum]